MQKDNYRLGGFLGQDAEDILYNELMEEIGLQRTKSSDQEPPLNINEAEVNDDLNLLEVGSSFDFHDFSYNLGKEDENLFANIKDEKYDPTDGQREVELVSNNFDILNSDVMVPASGDDELIHEEAKEIPHDKKLLDQASINESCSKSTTPDSEKFDIVSFLSKRLELSHYNKIYEGLKQNRPRGRPRIIKDTDKDVIWNQIFEQLAIKGSKRRIKQRIDAKTASICRDSKKVVDHILKYVGSKCRYKSSDMEEVIDSYAEAFTVGFVPAVLEGGAVEDKIRLFCQFIVLSYPEAKVGTIISSLEEANYLSFDESQNLLRQVKIRKLSSKKNFQNLVSQNVCFKNIILKLLAKLDSSPLNNKEEFRTILGQLIAEEI
ncbi:unnamed protein product [Moneuplotes crassus]|uniref:Uncharacterized protein n=1 Tax=Euplotes crassus TaxID=5936 RepID=A0AAD1UN69_EUPCR|nr:unnamed protein product [Moneuplotes crassus]